MELQEVINSLEIFSGHYKSEEVTYAMEHKEEITPYLLNIIENVMQRPEKYVEKENYWGHIYALILLGYFEEKKFHQQLIKLCCLPDKTIEVLFGDMALENFKVVLYQTCGGSVDQIKELILNKSAPDSSRNSAASALLYAVADGIISREEILTFLCTLFTGDETDRPSAFWSFLACEICDLCPDDSAFETLKNAYENGLIDESIVNFIEFEEAMDLGVENSIARIKKDKQLHIPEDIHRTMSWWACFEENNKFGITPSFQRTPKNTKNHKAKRKKRAKKKKQLHKKKKKKKKR